MSLRRAAVVILASSLSSALASAQTSPGGGCEVSPTAAADLATLRAQDATRSRAGNVGARLALARKHSTDWMSQLELQALVLNSSSFPDERRQFSAVYRGLTANPLFAQLLEARLAGAQDLDAIIPKALAEAPASPFVLRVVLERFVPGLSESPDIAAHYVRARRNCPDSVWPFRSLETIREPGELHAELRILRDLLVHRVLSRASGPGDTAHWGTLFRFGPPVFGLETLRADLDSLRKLGLQADPTWLTLISSAYESAFSDRATADALRKEYDTLHPANEQVCRFRRVAGQPALEKFELCRAHRIVALGLEVLRDPKLPGDRFDEILAWTLAAQEYSPETWQLPPVRYQAAKLLLERNRQLSEVPRLVNAELEEAEGQTVYWERRVPAVAKIPGETRIDQTRRDGREFLAKHALAISAPEQAATILDQIRADLDSAKPADDFVLRKLLERRATCETLAKQAGLKVRPTPAAPPVPEASLGEFNAPDLDGRTWTAADLRGRLVFVYLWNPSIHGSADMPFDELERLHRLWRDRSGSPLLLVVASTGNPQQVKSAMKEKTYTFAVLLAGPRAVAAFSPIVPAMTGEKYFLSPGGKRLEMPLLFIANSAAEVDRVAAEARGMK